MTDPILTPKQVAELLQVHVGTLEKWRSHQTGPKWMRLGEGKRAAIRYRTSDINAYIDSAASKT